MILNSPYISGSLTVTGNITACGGVTISGSIASASYAVNASYLNNSGSGEFVPTGSFNTASGSFSTRISAIEGKYITTGSNTFIGNQTITGSILQSGSLSVNGCIVSTGQIVAQTINVQQVTSSVVYSCGSNIFGCAITDVQQMTGSVRVTGSLNVVGNTCVTSICSPSIIGGTVNATTIYGSTVICSPSICTTGNSCFGSDVFVYGDLRMQGIDSFIWSPSGSSTGYTGFYDAFNNQVSLTVCNSSGHLLLQPIRCNVGVGVSNPGQKLEVAGVIHSFDRTSGAVDGAFYASKCGGTTSVIIRSCGITHFNGGNVGINTDTPITKLQICTTATTENVLTISNGTQQLQLGVNNGANGSYLFEKNKGLRFGTCDTERLLITDTGIATFACQVCSPRFQADNYGIFRASAFRGGLFTYDGVSGAGTDYSPTIFAEGGAGGGNFYITTGGSATVNMAMFCSGITCFRCQICAPSGVRFASGGSTLSNYETGTWTPFVSRLTSVPTVSYASREGSYTRIGNMVYVFWDINISSLTGGSGVAVICNLPITVSGGMGGYSVAQHRDASLIAASGGTALKGFAEKGNNYVYLQYDYIGACGFCTVPGSGGNAVFNSSGRMTGYVIYQA